MTAITTESLRRSVRVDLRELDTVLDRYGFARALSDRDIHNGRELAARLIGPDLADVAVFRTIQDHSGVGMLVFRESDQITGVAGFVTLSDLGREAILSGSFDGLKPNLNHIAATGEPVSATYAWLGAANTHASRAAVVTVSSGLRTKIFGTLPSFARAVTPEGAAALQTYLQMDALPTRPGLYWHPGVQKPDRAVPTRLRIAREA